MSVTKIAILVGASVITAGSTAAVATRDKWWPKSEEDKPSSGNKDSVGSSGPAPEVEGSAGLNTASQVPTR